MLKSPYLYIVSATCCRLKFDSLIQFLSLRSWKFSIRAWNFFNFKYSVSKILLKIIEKNSLSTCCCSKFMLHFHFTAEIDGIFFSSLFECFFETPKLFYIDLLQFQTYGKYLPQHVATTICYNISNFPIRNPISILSTLTLDLQKCVFSFHSFFFFFLKSKWWGHETQQSESLKLVL